MASKPNQSAPAVKPKWAVPPVADTTNEPEEAVVTEDSAPVVEDLPKTPEVKNKVTVTVPKGFTLVIDNFNSFKYGQGIQEMDRTHAEHWYSKANGVKIYNPDGE